MGGRRRREGGPALRPARAPGTQFGAPCGQTGRQPRRQAGYQADSHSPLTADLQADRAEGAV
jgi:hypothetical protein